MASPHPTRGQPSHSLCHGGGRNQDHYLGHGVLRARCVPKVPRRPKRTQPRHMRAPPRSRHRRRHAECPKKYAEEVKALFPNVDTAGMLIVPTCQNSDIDLVKVGEEVETEKDRLLERFMGWAKMITDELIAKGHWSDYIDPCSGLPMVNKENQAPTHKYSWKK